MIAILPATDRKRFPSRAITKISYFPIIVNPFQGLGVIETEWKGKQQSIAVVSIPERD